MTSPRDVMEARVNAALARYDQAIHDGTPRTLARRHMVDHILRGWDTTTEHAVHAAVAGHQRLEQQRRQDAALPLLQALKAVSHG